jgi:hypothetical protein
MFRRTYCLHLQGRCLHDVPSEHTAILSLFMGFSHHKKKSRLVSIMIELLRVSHYFAKENRPILQCPFYRDPELDSCAIHVMLRNTTPETACTSRYEQFLYSHHPLGVLSFAPGAWRARYRPVLAVGRSAAAGKSQSRPQSDRASTMNCLKLTTGSDGTFFAN